jgi:hypothetical protein
MSVNTASQLFDKYNRLTTAPNVFKFATPTQTTQNAREAFPLKIGSTDRDDVKYGIRKELVGKDAQGNNVAGSAVVPGVGMAIAGEEFFDYAQRKEEQEMLFDFKKFVAAQADLSSPASAQWWFEKFPWMKELRLEQVNQQGELQKQLARIQITGPQNEEDFMHLYLVNKGLIRVTEQPLHRLGQATDITSETFRQGFFNPLAQPKYQTMQTATKPLWSNPLAVLTGNPAAYAPVGRAFPTDIDADFAGGPSFYGGNRGPPAGSYTSAVANPTSNSFWRTLFG